MRNIKKIIAAVLTTATLITSINVVPVKAATNPNATKPLSASVSCTTTALAKVKKNIKFSFEKTPTGVIVNVKNNTKYNIKVYGEVTFLNSKKKKVASFYDNNYCLQSKKSCVLEFLPLTSKGKRTSYSKFKAAFTIYVADTKYTNVSKITYKLAKKDNYSMEYKFKNNATKNFKFIYATMIFYNKSGKIIGVTSRYASCEKKKSSSNVTFYYPTDSKYNYIKPAKCKLVVNYAYA